jgi:ATP-dependent helicase HrpA
LDLQKELAWLQKDLLALNKLKDLYVTLGSADELMSGAYANARAHLIKVSGPLIPLRDEKFKAAAKEARQELGGVAPQLVDWIAQILQLRQQILLYRNPYPSMRSDLDGLVPKNFLTQVPFSQLKHLPRYLKAILIRAERAALNPLKDKEKIATVLPYVDALNKLPNSSGSKKNEFRWLLEEFKVSVFAQELGTVQPVSPKRLNALLAAN